MAQLDQPLDQFVQQALAKGESEQAVREALLAQGWDAAEIDRALKGWGGTAFGLAIPRPLPQLTARDCFLYAVLFIGLMSAGWALAALGFDWFNILLNENEAQQPHKDTFRLWLAIILVSYPIYLFVQRFLSREAAAAPMRPHSPVRRWAINGLMLTAALVVMIDGVILLYYFLDGDFTLQFGAKVGWVAFIFALIYAGYAGQEDQAENQPSQRAVWARRALHVIVVVAIAAGFVTTGSPQTARDERADLRTRIALDAAHRGAQCYANETGKLAKTIDQISQHADCGYVGNGATALPAIEYRVVDDSSIELCAEFTTDTTGQMHTKQYPNFNNHADGHVCFALDITPSANNHSAAPKPIAR